MTKIESGGVSMTTKKVTEVAHDYTFLNYEPPRPQKYLNPQERKKVAGPGMNPAPIVFLPGHSKEKVGKEPPPRYVDNG